MKINDIHKLISEEDCYHCYSFNLKRFLENEKSVYHIDVGSNPKTKKTYFIYIRTDELSEALSEWTQRKVKKDYFFIKDGE